MYETNSDRRGNRHKNQVDACGEWLDPATASNTTMTAALGDTLYIARFDDDPLVFFLAGRAPGVASHVGAPRLDSVTVASDGAYADLSVITGGRPTDVFYSDSASVPQPCGWTLLAHDDGISGTFAVRDTLPSGLATRLYLVSDAMRDTDGDGMPDWWEEMYGLDPSDLSDAALDTDGDGLANLAGQVTTAAWDCCHKVSETGSDGSTTTWDYYEEGRMVAASRLIPLDMTNVTWLTTCYEYDGLGRQTATWQTNYAAQVGLPATRTAYDALGRVVARVDTLGNTTTTTYSPDGRVVTVQYPNTSTRTVSRSADGDILSVTGTAATPEFHTYGILPDGTCWSRKVQGETASSPRFAKRYVNMLGSTIRVEESGFDGAVLATSYGYDGYGRCVSQLTEGEPVLRQEYNACGEASASVIQSGELEWRRSDFSNCYELRGASVWWKEETVGIGHLFDGTDPDDPQLTQYGKNIGKDRFNKFLVEIENLYGKKISPDLKAFLDQLQTKKRITGYPRSVKRSYSTKRAYTVNKYNFGKSVRKYAENRGLPKEEDFENPYGEESFFDSFSEEGRARNKKIRKQYETRDESIIMKVIPKLTDCLEKKGECAK